MIKVDSTVPRIKYYEGNLYQSGLNEIYSPVGYSGDCNQFNERSRLTRCGDQNQHFRDNHTT